MASFGRIMRRGKQSGQTDLPQSAWASFVMMLGADLLTWDAPQEELVPTARELGIGFLAYSPLGRGMLTGAYKVLNDVPAQQAAFNPRFGEANFDKVCYLP
jgi:aryl-alcohol dehydrogenase-like predicted oxidoreductase